VLWLIPVFLALHNAEEALTFPSYLPYIATRVPVRLPPDAYSRLLVALAVVTAIPFVVAVWAYARPRSRAALWTLLLIQTVVFVNAISHALVAAFVLRGYGPGLLTALALNLPFSIYLLRRAVRERWLSPRALVLLVPSAVVVHGPVLVGLMVMAGIFARRG
jgi:hypothetical protein